MRRCALTSLTLFVLAVSACGGDDAPALPLPLPSPAAGDDAGDAATRSPDPIQPPPVAGGATDGAAPPPIPTDTSEAACAADATAYCARHAQVAADLFTLLYGDLPSCEKSEGEKCKWLMAQPDAGWTVAQRRACAAAWPSATIDQVVYYRARPAACQSPAGKKPDNETCGSYAECASGACLRSGAETCGACGSRKAAGQPCSSVSDCATDLDCFYDLSDERYECAAIRPIVAVGTPCTTHETCGLYRYCRGTYVWSEATQTWPIQNGTCQALTLAPVGAACGEFLGPRTGNSIPLADLKLCHVSGYCELTAEGEGTCKRKRAAGESCDATNACERAAPCHSSSCTPFASLVCN